MAPDLGGQVPSPGWDLGSAPSIIQAALFQTPMGALCPKSPELRGFAQGRSAMKVLRPIQRCTQGRPAPPLDPASILGQSPLGLCPCPWGQQHNAEALPTAQPWRRWQRPARCFLFRCGWDFPALTVGPRSAPAAALFSISKAAEEGRRLQRHCHFESSQRTAAPAPHCAHGDAVLGGGTALGALGHPHQWMCARLHVPSQPVLGSPLASSLEIITVKMLSSAGRRTESTEMS